jgi:hypothetical protein
VTVPDNLGYELASQSYTAKYAAANGALIWEVHYTDPKVDRGKAHSLAVGAGFVVVAGEANGDYLTVKYLDGPTPQTTAAQVFSSNKARLTARSIQTVLPQVRRLNMELIQDLPALPRPQHLRLETGLPPCRLA